MKQHSVEQSMNRLLRAGLLKKEDLLDFFAAYAEITVLPDHPGKGVTAFHCPGMTDNVQLNKYYHPLFQLADIPGKSISESDLPPVRIINNMKEVLDLLFAGHLIFHKEHNSIFLAANIADIPRRNTEESKTEVSIKGPRDGFIEESELNISLIRKRLKTDQLVNEQFIAGTLTDTKISLLYIKGKASEATILEIRERLHKMEVESLLSAGQLEQWLANSRYSLFPLFDYATRPDYAAQSLLKGRFLLIVNGSPMVLVGPANILLLLKSPEDLHFPFYSVFFERFLRLVGLCIAIFLPGFWIALSSVNIDLIPLPLLATVVISREGLPLPFAFEAFLILMLFELFREAGLRMPKVIGQTISVAGTIIIGDAAIRAGLTSATMIFVIAVTAVCTYTLVNQSLAGTVSVLRIIIMLISSLLGIYGFFLAVIALVIYLANIRSYNIPYLEPMVSMSFKSYLSAMLTNPLKHRNGTEKMLKKWRDER